MDGSFEASVLVEETLAEFGVKCLQRLLVELRRELVLPLVVAGEVAFHDY